MWQYADNQPVPGFPAPVDINQVSPTNLDHIVIGDELVMDAAATKAFADLQNEVALTSTFMGQRFDRIDKTLQVIYRGIPGDPTHPGLIDVIAKIEAIGAQPAPTGSDAAELKTVLDNFLADLHGLNWTVGIK